MASPNSDDHTPTTAHSHGSLRGAFTAVVLMSIFFGLTWFLMFAIAMERR